jgi:hypothetical protein
MRELPLYTNWSYAHRWAIELASELASLAPGDLNRSSSSTAARGGRVGGSCAPVLPARGGKKLDADDQHDEHAGRTAAQVQGDRAPGCLSRDDDGSLSINGISALRTSFEPFVPASGT